MEQLLDEKKAEFPAKHVTFELLPVDAIFLVLKWLEPTDLLVMCCVSKRLNELASNDCLWMKFSKGLFNQAITFQKATKTYEENRKKLYFSSPPLFLKST